MSPLNALLWAGFAAIIVAMMALDLFVLIRRPQAVSLRRATLWSALWVAVSLAFGGVVFSFRGTEAGTEYLTAYLIEKSLSFDNLFVFLVIFQYFAVPAELQPKVLRWGIIGALVMRLGFILAGAAFLEAFEWATYVFGAVVLLAAARLIAQDERAIDPNRNPVVRIFRRFIPVGHRFHSDRFLLRAGRLWLATPLLVVLLLVETSDLMFAIDSIPAIFTVTRDPFIVYTSNAFAILGLRAMYFLIAGLAASFRYLRHGAIAVLVFVGTKMLLSDVIEVPVYVSLAVVGLILAASIAASLLRMPPAPRRVHTP